MRRDLREVGALSPDRAVEAEDGSGGKMLALAVDVAHQVLINVSLPRHFVLKMGSRVSVVERREEGVVWMWE